MSEHRARKRFGQNFLHDPAIIQRIIQSMDPQPTDFMVEIGPGLGALTAPLLDKLQCLHVIELDRDVIPHLRILCSDDNRLIIHEGDALRFDFSKLTSESGSLRVAGNLPYNISTPLLFHLLTQVSLIRDMHFMLQKEVVDRMVAQPGEKAYGRLSASLAAYVRCDFLFKVRPGAFNPPPRVNSAIVRLTPYKPDFNIHSARHYEEVLRTAFGTRRKTLGNALKPLCGNTMIQQAGIDPRLRAERVSPAEFAALANLLYDKES